MSADPDRSLRPRSLAEYIGQAKIRENVATYCAAARERAEALDHVLLLGPPGLGKTTLAHIIARELDTTILTTSGPALKEPFALVAVLRRLQPRSVLFIDEIHRLDAVVEEMLYPAMEDYQVDVPADEDNGEQAGTRIALPPFTLIGATTRAGLLTAPLRDRFGIVERLAFYTPEELAQIVTRSAGLLRVEIDGDGAMEIGRRARGTPRVANRLLRRVRDFARNAPVDRARAEAALERLEVDRAGLDAFDRDLLRAVIEKFGGGPVGVESLAVALGEDAGTIADVYEPFLIQGGWLSRSGRGRTVMPRAYDHLGFKRPKGMTTAKAADADGGCSKCNRPIGRARIPGQPAHLCAACHSEAKVLPKAGPDLFTRSDVIGADAWADLVRLQRDVDAGQEGAATALRARLDGLRERFPSADLISRDFYKQLEGKARA